MYPLRALRRILGVIALLRFCCLAAAVVPRPRCFAMTSLPHCSRMFTTWPSRRYRIASPPQRAQRIATATATTAATATITAFPAKP
jgi:hypothetical protein